MLSVCVVVTVKNDARGARSLLRDLHAQSRQPDMIVLAVAVSSDQTLTAAQAAQAEWGSRLLVVPVGEASRAAARNMAVARSVSDVVVFTDAGCRLDGAWLAELLKPFAQPEVDLVSGLTLGRGTNDFERAQIPFVLVHPQTLGAHPLPATRNMAIRRTTFVQAGGFPTASNAGEDFAFARHLRHLGVKAVAVPQAKVWWRPRRTLWQFCSMIAHVTIGDVRHRSPRPQHKMLLLRYALLTISLLLIGMVWSKLLALWWGVSVMSVFLGLKTWRHATWYGNHWTPLLQIACDLSMLVGLGIGWVQRIWRR